MQKLIAGQEVEVPGFILVDKYGNVSHSTHEFADHGYMTVMPHTVKFTVPDTFNPIAAEVATLEKQRKRLQDEYMASVSIIAKRIADLQCIELAPKGDL